MGFGHLPQWKRHVVVDGRCTRCQEAFPVNGVMCYIPAYGTQRAMTFRGNLPHATDCLRREESSDDDH